MKIVIAPDSFKGSLSATKASAAMAAGVRQLVPEAEIVCIPLADGGEGTVEAWLRAKGGALHAYQVLGPLGEPIDASYGVFPDGTAVIESAAASGLTLVPQTQRNPLLTTTYGMGQLIAAAIENGAKKLIIGLGGTATNDCGAGAMQALGASFLDSDGNPLPAPMTGGMLRNVAAIDTSNMLSYEHGTHNHSSMLIQGYEHATHGRSEVEVILASDVMNPLTGPNGASAVYGPQKGATPEMVLELDAGLARFAEIIRRDLGMDISAKPGAGAAGGLGGALMAVFGARACSGIELILEAADFDESIHDADWVLTGEGSIDRQTLNGKTVAGIAERCRKFPNVRVIAIGGVVEPDAAAELKRNGIFAVASASPPDMPRDQAMAMAAQLLENATAAIMRNMLGTGA